MVGRGFIRTVGLCIPLCAATFWAVPSAHAETRVAVCVSFNNICVSDSIGNDDVATAAFLLETPCDVGVPSQNVNYGVGTLTICGFEESTGGVRTTALDVTVIGNDIVHVDRDTVFGAECSRGYYEEQSISVAFQNVYVSRC